ncbi:MAG TPA: glycosyltransferase family 9 protein [Methylophilaceae bacterium]|jgi:heptosyltransferase-2
MKILRYVDQRYPLSKIPQKINLLEQPDIQRILIIKWGAMGDIANSTAVIEDIFQAFPHASIDLNTMSAYEPMFAADKRFNRIFSVDLRGKERGWPGIKHWLKLVRQGRYDVVIDLQSNDRSRFMLILLQLTGRGIRYRVGNNPCWPYNITPPKLPVNTHGFDRFRATLTSAGIPVHTASPVLHIPPANQESAAGILAEHGLEPKQFAILAPGCHRSSHLRRWGVDNYAALAAKLHEAGVEKIVILGGPDERDDCRLIAEKCPGYAINLCEKTQILDVPVLAESALCVIANDTGIAHLAASTATPMLVVFGPSDPHRAKPVGSRIIGIQVDIADLPCLNCYYKQPCSHHSCMKAITPEFAFAELQTLLGTDVPGQGVGTNNDATAM